MVVEPKVKGFICTTAHPKGCALNVDNQIEYVKSHGNINGAKKVLVIGSSTGYGLASRITAAFAMGADTIGVAFDKESNGKRTATPGYYNTAEFDKAAKEAGLKSVSLNGDAFSQDIKNQVVDVIKKDFGKIDLVVYSVAAPRRTVGDVTYSSVLKTVGEEFTQKNWNLRDDTVSDATISVATDEEIQSTIKVMGGEDWIEWIDLLKAEDLLSDNAITVAYSYIGPKLTYPIYHEGSIGQAKKHLAESAGVISKKYADVNAYVSVNKALVTQASAAIPVVPLYLAILYKLMKERGTHEGCIEQMYRLFSERVYTGGDVVTEADGLIHIDDLELEEGLQKEIMDIWANVSTDNLKEVADTEGYWEDFYHMFGFKIDGVDYTEDVEV